MPSCGGFPFESAEKAYRKSGKAKTIFLLMAATGMTEKELLALPLQRLNTYTEVLNELNKKE